MCQDCHAARAFQNSGRAYDDPHPAEMVGNPLHKWLFYSREVWLRCRSFDRLLDEARRALDAVAVAREALAANPGLEAQKAVYDSFEHVNMYYEHGVIMLGLTAGEALDEAVQGLAIVATALVHKADHRRDGQRRQHLLAREEAVEEAISAFRRDVASESEKLKEALPDYENIAPKWTLISEAGW
ncbi:MAG: hypothetical protein KGS72_22435 [Cyanobacteria bacterium REEB67]|nr:hypothetical protein [Cyanobacteria bacterium REEB67]